MKARKWVWGFWVISIQLIAVCALGEGAIGLGPLSGRRAALREYAADVPAVLRAAHLAVMQEDAPDVYRVEATAAGFQAANPRHGLGVVFAPQGVEVMAQRGGNAWSFQATPTRWGCDGEMTKVGRVEPVRRGRRVEYRHEGVNEWYVNGPEGLEQGFDLPARPPCGRGGASGVVIELGGGPQARFAKQGHTAVLRDASGTEVLRYGDLFVVDAAGRELPAALEVNAGILSIRFDDTDATYPVIVDPWIWSQQGRLLAADGMEFDELGTSVALSGDTAIVGAPVEGSEHGAAYVFVRSGASWTQQQKLTVADGKQFGLSVSLSGDTAVVGGFNGVYVFVRSGASWTQQQELTAILPLDMKNALLGSPVAVSGDTAVVRASLESQAPATAFVFVRSGATWTQQQWLTPDDAMGTNEVGRSLAIDGDTVILGSSPLSSPGAAHVFVRSGTSWTKQQELTASDGATGDGFGSSVAVSGDTVVVGATGAGAAYVFVRSGTSWTQQQELTASDGAPPEQLGVSVAASGDTVVVGAGGVDPSADGTAYVFARSGTSWSQQQKLRAGSCNTTGDLFGRSVAVDGETAIIGAFNSTYVFALHPDGDAGGGGTCPDGGGGSDGSGGSGGSEPPGNCGCGVSGSPVVGGLWVGLGLIWAMRRKKSKPSTRGV